MRRTIRYLFTAAVITVAIPALVRAQDAPSAPLRSPTAVPEESPPAQVEATPTPRPLETPAPVTEATPAPVTEATPAPKPVDTSPPKAEESPVTEARKPVAVDQPEEVSGGRGSIASRLKALEARWETSKINHDTSVIQELVADDYVGTSSNGKVGYKSTLLSEARKDKNIYDSAAARSMSVRVYGPRVAVVVGVAKETGRTKDGRRFSHSYRFTDTWMQRDGKWQCIASAAVALPKR